MAGPSRGGGLLLWLLVLTLAWTTVWLVAERNARRWSLQLDHDQLVVSRGRHFLFGEQRVGADDPAFGKVYGPIVVPAGTKLAAADFDNQVALDQAIFEALLPLVAASRGGDVAGRARAGAMIGRLAELPGLTSSELGRLAALRGDFAYDEAQADLREALRLVHDAWRKLRLVQTGDGEHALEAATMAAGLANLAATLDDLAAARAPRPENARARPEAPPK